MNNQCWLCGAVRRLNESAETEASRLYLYTDGLYFDLPDDGRSAFFVGNYSAAYLAQGCCLCT